MRMHPETGEVSLHPHKSRSERYYFGAKLLAIALVSIALAFLVAGCLTPGNQESVAATAEPVRAAAQALQESTPQGSGYNLIGLIVSAAAGALAGGAGTAMVKKGPSDKK